MREVIGETNMEPHQVQVTVSYDEEGEAHFEVLDTLDFESDYDRALACIVRGMISYAQSNTKQVVELGLNALIEDGVVSIEDDDEIGEPQGNA